MRVVAIVLLCNLGCRAAPGAGEPARVAEPPREAPPAAETMTYVSGAKLGPAATTDAATGDPAIETDAAAEKKVAAVAGVPAKIDAIAAARELALSAADGALGQTGERLMTPALVPAWPAGKRALVFVVYPLTSSKAGINRFTVGAPVEVTIDLVEGTATTRKLRRSAVLAEIEVGRDSSTVRQNIDTAEQTLIELLLERRSVDRSLVLLDGYREWFNHHLNVMTDLDHRMPKGIRWLRQPQVP